MRRGASIDQLNAGAPDQRHPVRAWAARCVEGHGDRITASRDLERLEETPERRPHRRPEEVDAGVDGDPLAVDVDPDRVGMAAQPIVPLVEGDTVSVAEQPRGDEPRAARADDADVHAHRPFRAAVRLGRRHDSRAAAPAMPQLWAAPRARGRRRDDGCDAPGSGAARLGSRWYHWGRLTFSAHPERSRNAPNAGAASVDERERHALAVPAFRRLVRGGGRVAFRGRDAQPGLAGNQGRGHLQELHLLPGSAGRRPAVPRRGHPSPRVDPAVRPVDRREGRRGGAGRHGRRRERGLLRDSRHQSPPEHPEPPRGDREPSAGRPSTSRSASSSSRGGRRTPTTPPTTSIRTTTWTFSTQTRWPCTRSRPASRRGRRAWSPSSCRCSRPSRLPEANSRWAPPPPPGVLAVLNDREVPGIELANVQFAARVRTTVAGGTCRRATTRDSTTCPSSARRASSRRPGLAVASLTPVFARIRAVGMDFSTTVRGIEVHGEAAVKFTPKNGREDRFQSIGGFTYTWDGLGFPWLDAVTLTLEYAGEIGLRIRDAVDPAVRRRRLRAGRPAGLQRLPEHRSPGGSCSR